MLNTYKAILRGNRLEWSDDAPEGIAPERAVPVHVTILEQPTASIVETSQGQRMVAALEQLAAMHALADIADPAMWERELRQDRPLPDRNS